MIAGLQIRNETADDHAAIHAVTQRAFATQSHADGDEQDLVDLLRVRGELTLSLVAEFPQLGVVGHIGFSPVTLNGQDCGWQQLAPVSVEPNLHHQGIGSALIHEGIERLREQGICGIGVVGDPRYYERFGFIVVPGLAPEGPDAAYFRAMVLREPAPQGVVRYASAFG